mmetsp:Transcript_22505/g.53111  ORF Transcript_22505/g.53111 Transcript_22505/m.53111 type:complete len:607 (-) Transcript_22505:903-2723(-)
MDSFVHDRSSSQPRPSHPADRLSLSSVPMISRSASQPRALQNTHFLDGFNVADCFDVRAIPDPPSPSPHNTTSGHRRRVSSAVLRPMSSRDITNRGNNPCTLTSESDGIKLSSSIRRKRKTLSHVPSPMISGEEQNPELHSTDSLCNEEFSSVEERPNTVQSNSFEDGSLYETAKNYPKRRRKRQSMVIPSDLPFEEKTGELPKLPSPIESQRKKRSFYPGDFKNMQKLRNLVRGYCSLSSDEERGASDVGKEIQALTGYALPRRVVTEGDGDKSQAMLSNRRLVIQKITPVLAQIEKRKERDIKQWESTTGCHVTKSERSGRYRYYDIESNQRVASQEYKRRYIAFLEDSRPDRLARAQAWMNKLSPVEEENFKMHSNSFPMYEDPVSINDARQHHNPMDYSEMKQKEAFDPPRTNSLKRVDSTESRYVGTTDRMEICDMSMSLDYGEQQSVDTSMYNNNCQVLPPTMATTFDRSEIAEISEASSEDTDDNPNESRSSSPTHESDFMGAVDNFEAAESVVLDAREARDDNGSSKMEKGGKDTDESIPLLPFPSRCRESMDPEIAAAERRLWDKIDLALHKYSGEVMMIEKKKREAAGRSQRNIAL